MFHILKATTRSSHTIYAKISCQSPPTCLIDSEVISLQCSFIFHFIDPFQKGL